MKQRERRAPFRSLNSFAATQSANPSPESAASANRFSVGHCSRCFYGGFDQRLSVGPGVLSFGLSALLVSVHQRQSRVGNRPPRWGYTQEAGLVPIVEAEVRMDGEHSLERCRKATEEALRNVIIQLNCQRVLLEGIILKPNMVTASNLTSAQFGSGWGKHPITPQGSPA